MLRHIIAAGVASVLIGAIASPSAKADGWQDGLSGHKSYSTGSSVSEPAASGRKTRSATKSRRPARPAVARKSTGRGDGSEQAAASSRKRTTVAAAPVRKSRPAASGDTSSSSTSSAQQGIASFYWQPQRLATGGYFNPDAMTAAHRTLPFWTRVRVTHVRNGRSVDVVINDRGPYISGRIIDLSRAAAGVIGMREQGIAQVRVQVLGRR